MDSGNNHHMTGDSVQLDVSVVVSDDLTLVHASKNGEVGAFEHLVRRYDRKLLRIARSVTHNMEDAQDAVQEAFFKAFQNLGQFREESQFSTWLIRITLNQSLLKLRKQRAIREVSPDEDFQVDGEMLPMEIADWAPNPEQLYWASELRNILVTALEELRPILRTVFVLRDIEGLSTAQTAEVLNLSHAAVKARLWRVRLQLRERLNDHFSKTESPRTKLFPTDRRIGRILGLCAGSLDPSISQRCSISLAISPDASATTAAKNQMKHI